MVMLLLAGDVAAEVPVTLSHNGYLTDGQGKGVTGAWSFSFGIYGSPDGSDLVWSEEIANVQVADGFYAVTLGLSNALQGVFNPESGGGRTRRDVYLEVTVDGTKMLPRQRISSVPYSLVADDAVGDIHPASITVNGKRGHVN